MLYAISTFFVVWMGIPKLIGIFLREFEIKYDPILANETSILLSSLFFIYLMPNEKEYGFNLKGRNRLLSIMLWAFLLQLLPMAAIILSFHLSLPLPKFVYSESLLGIFLKYVIYAPLCEEIFMRGLVQTNLSSLSGSLQIRRIQLSTSVVVTAFAFGVMHFITTKGIKDFISPFILGLIAGYHREKSNSLYPAFVAHATYNFCGGFFARVMYLIIK